MLAQTKKEQEIIPLIKEVVVYTSSAEVLYEKKLTIPKGQSTILFTDLSPFVAENSLNVSLSDATTNIISVSERINYVTEKNSFNAKVNSLTDSVALSKRTRGAINAKLDAIEREKDLLFKGESIGGMSTHGVSVAEIEKASAFFSKRYLELASDLYQLKEKEYELGQKEMRFEKQIKEFSTVTQKTTSEIKLILSATSEKEITVFFKFLVTKAGWTPLYDFKYEGANKPLQFVFRANVFNSSGTEWDDVKIKLSTADPLSGFKLPNSSSSRFSGVNFKQVEVVNAITEYTINHQYSIPSDSKPYLVDVDAYAMEANFNYLLIPKLDPFGFLMAKLPNWNKYNLISGTANIYNSGTYMGKTFLNTYSENDTLSIYLGKDKRVQCLRTEKVLLHKNFIAGNYSNEETKVEFTLKNNSNEILMVELIDQVPYFDKSDDDKMTIDGVDNALYDKEEGKLTWNFKLEVNQSIDLKYDYTIKSPKHGNDNYRPKKKKYRAISCPAF